jgi:hypothetical protein
MKSRIDKSRFQLERTTSKNNQTLQADCPELYSFPFVTGISADKRQ